MVLEWAMVSMMNGSDAMCPATLPEMFMSSLSAFTSPWKTFLQSLMENPFIESVLNILKFIKALSEWASLNVVHLCFTFIR